MGRAKAEWMRLEELEAMHDWIEDNYGEDAGEESSDTWNEAVRKFEEYCENKERLEYEAHLQEEYDYYIYLTLKDADENFDRDIHELVSLLREQSPDSPSQTFLKMIYAHAVTILEVYLEDITKALIMSNDEHLANTIRNVRPFSDTKFKLGDISIQSDGIKKFVLHKLSENVFHDIPKVLNMLCGVLDKKLEVSISDVCAVTSARHDIVHRNGKDKDGNNINLDHASTTSALRAVILFNRELRDSFV